MTRYLEWSFQTNRHCGENKPGYRAYCHPDNFDAATNLLYRNNGDGTFTDVSAKAGIAAAPARVSGVAFSDYDRDGFVDVYVANDSVQCFLYHNNRDGTFTEVGLLAGVGVQRRRQDLRRHGRGLRRLRQRRPRRHLRHRPLERALPAVPPERRRQLPRRHEQSGVGGATLPFSGWSTRFVDYDNDGWKDLFVAQGHVMDTIEKTSPNLQIPAAAAAAAQRAGRFVRVMGGEALQKEWAGRGAAFGDLDNDGDTDVVVSNVGQKAYVLRNDGGSAANWLASEPSERDRTATGSAARSGSSPPPA